MTNIKKIKYIFFTAFVASLITSCGKKYDQQNQDKEILHKPETRPIVLRYKSELDEYRAQYYFGSRPTPDPIYIKKLRYPKKTIYVYRYYRYSRVDSLVLAKGSVELSSEKLLLLNKRLIDFKGKKLEIKKYQSLNKRTSNLFINDSLGLIMEFAQTHPYGSVLREYNATEYRELCNKIIRDSLFFRFDFKL